MEHYPDITNLALFLKVIEAGSFSKVCRQLNIPKASLSRRISQLEEFYDSQLLIRNTRHLKLTEVGREIHHRAHTILSLLEETQSTIVKTKARPNGLLRITAGVEYGLSVVSPIVDEFLKKYAEVNIELDLTGRRVDLIYEGFDLGVRVGPLEDSTLSMRKFGSFRYGLFAGQKFIDAHKPLSVDKLKKVPTLAFTRIGKQKTWVLINQLDERTIEINPRLLSNNYWVLLNAAKANNGVVFMPIFLAEKEVNRGGIQQILPNWCSEEIPVHFIYPEQKYLTSKVRTFIDFATERFK
jgi:LysR family transcriptional regulator for bpeEF and oprC